ncbi:helix-turn-helix transcriptional regulator [Bacillus mycoides]|uniref:helix-turn-helix domain-containing protein n=1 Tax=Bacillus mycoides TaxID=1405 RepID=UPI002E1E23FA|nr:helix-turn-helix transcriptional regulator [Bacillus mycoides]
MSLGQQLKEFRTAKEFSQEDVARKIGVTRQAVYKWENDKSYPDIDNLILLSELYNVTLDELIKGNQEFKKKINIDEDEPDIGFFILLIFLVIVIPFISHQAYIILALAIVFYDEIGKIINFIIDKITLIIKAK